MHLESIKLSPKKGGNGYTSSYTFSIGSKEASACGLIGKKLIKIIDEEAGVISLKPNDLRSIKKFLKKLCI